MKPELTALHKACARVARVLNSYVPAIPGQRSEVYCLGATVEQEGEHKGKRMTAVFLRFVSPDGEDLEFMCNPIFDDTDALDHIIHVTVGVFLTGWFNHQKAQESSDAPRS